MPDFDTSPIGPGPVMFAGVMPTLDWPGEMTPGQLGPRVRVPFSGVRVKAAVSATGMPSVMMTTSGSAASIASTTAPFANGGGTKTTETSAPVAATASATVPKTGMVRDRPRRRIHGLAGLARG